MNESITALTPLIIGLIASLSAGAASFGPSIRYARLEKLVAARGSRVADKRLDLLIDVLAAGLAVDEAARQSRTRIWWAVSSGLCVVGCGIALLYGTTVWTYMPTGQWGPESEVVRVIGLAALLILFPLLTRSLSALFRPQPKSLLPGATGKLLNRVQEAVEV